MSNIFDYLAWRGDIPLQQMPVNDIDALILSQAAYFLYESLPEDRQSCSLGELWDFLKDQEISHTFVAEKDRKMLEILSQSPRFRDLTVCDFSAVWSDEADIQFAAVTFMLPDGIPYIAFRGTDHTLVGWKEDLYMAFSDMVPAQAHALQYLKTIIDKYHQPVVMSGHSKGGNLAMYAAVAAEPEQQAYVLQVFVHDGPGLPEELFLSEGYERIKNRLRVFLPEKSMVGILMRHPEAFNVVKSDAVGPMQHDPYSWQLMGSRFEYADGLRNISLYVENLTRKWIQDVDEEQLHFLVDTIFGVLEATEAVTLDEMVKKIRKNPRLLITVVKDMDEDAKKIVMDIIGVMAGTAFHEATAEIREKRENLLPWKNKAEAVEADSDTVAGEDE